LAYQLTSTPQPRLDRDTECEHARLQSNDDTGLQIGSVPNPNNVLENELEDDNDTPLPTLEEET